jgi:hypothetical protein
MKKLLSYLAPAAMLLLASCSTEPSDWTADKKVSLDMVEPGTRISENFDKNAAESEPKGSAINERVSGRTAKDDIPTAGAVMSADVQQGTAMKPGARTDKKKVDSATPDTARGQAGSRK